jgi:3D (Asp-Asp-Asp) domain-containing protein
MSYENSPAAQHIQQKIQMTQPIDVDGYLREQVAQTEAAVQNKEVQTAQEALAKSGDPLANPYTQPAAQPQAPQPEMRKPAFEMPDTSTLETPKVQESGYKMDPGKMLAAATPLLVDFLMGPHAGKGTAIAAKAFMDQADEGIKSKTNNDLEIQRLKLAAEKIKTARIAQGTDKDGKPLNKNNVVMVKRPDGSVVPTTWNEAVQNGWEPVSDAGPIKNNEMDLYYDEKGSTVKLPNAVAVQRGLKPVNKGEFSTYQSTIGGDKAADRESREKIAGMNNDARLKAAEMRAKEMAAKGSTQREIGAFNSFVGANSKYNKAEQDVWGVKNAMEVLNDGGIIGEGGIPTMVAKSIFKKSVTCLKPISRWQRDLLPFLLWRRDLPAELLTGNLSQLRIEKILLSFSVLPMLTLPIKLELLLTEPKKVMGQWG